MNTRAKYTVSFILMMLMLLPIATPAVSLDIIPIGQPGKNDSINRFPKTHVSPDISLGEVTSKLSPKILDREYLASITGTMLMDSKPYTKPGYIVYIGLDDFQAGLEKVKERLESYGLGKYVKISQVWPKLGMAFVEVNSNNPEFLMKIAVSLAAIGEVDYVDVNDIAYTTLFDSHYLLATSQIYSTLGVNGSGVTVAVLDTGIEEAHPELNGSVVAWADFVNNQTEPYDDEGHGTFVAGIIAARGVSPWSFGEGVWHTINYDDSSEFNYPGVANLTYEVDVTGYGGQNVTLEFWHRYWIEDSFDYGYIYYWFDSNTTPVQLASYTGTNFALHPESFNITVDAGATRLYISFQYEPDFSVQYGGWWLDNVTVYNASDPTDVLLFDDAEGPMPPEVVNSHLWSRTTNRLMGMAPGANLIGIKVCDSTGSCTFDAILNGIEFAINESADIISMSLGGPVLGYDVLMIAVDQANYVYNITPIIAAGNEGPGYYTIASPAAAEGAIAVGAATKTNTIARFSSWGPNPINYDIKPDITAYGRHVISTIAAEPSGYPPGTYLIAIGSGTSFSTPMVSGIVALIKEAHPDWTPEMIRSALISTATSLDPSSVSDWTMNPYIQGGGLVDLASGAVTTQFLPLPAKVSFGLMQPGDTAEALIDLVSFDLALTTATVVDVELYDQDGTPYGWVVSPSIGETITLNGTLNLTVSLPATAPGDKLYWGRITLDVGGETYQTIFGFYVPTLYWVNGTVYDVTTMTPVAGVNVSAVSPDLSTVYDWDITDASGNYELQVPSGVSVRIMAEMSGYYTYYSTPFGVSSDMRWDVYITPRAGYSPLNMLAIKDTAYGGWGDPDTENMTEVLALDGTLGIAMYLWNNSIQQVAADAILSGDFPVVAWFAGGIFNPVNDFLDYVAMILYSLFYDGGVLIEGGDVGWWLGGTSFMQYVAHAEYWSDMLPGPYTMEATMSHPLTWFLPSTTIDIDSSIGDGAGWPDRVYPAYGGFDVFNWSDATGYSSIVAYDPRPGPGDDLLTSEARTVYYAFPFDAILDPTLQAALLNYTLIWLFDRGPPVYTGTNITVDIDVDAGTAVAYWSIFTDEPFGIVSYNVYLNGSLIASGLPAWMTSFDLTPYVTPGEIYIVTIEAVDVLNVTHSVSGWFYMMPPGTQGSSFRFLVNGTFTDSAPGAYNAVFTINVTNAPVVLQILALSELPPETMVEIPPNPEAFIHPFDIKMINASGAGWLVVTISYQEPEYPLSENIVPLWFNGDKWVPVSTYTVDTAANTVTIWINATGTSPTLADLEGTPFVLYSEPQPLVGGEAVVGQSSTILVALVGVALLAVALAFRRRSS